MEWDDTQGSAWHRVSPQDCLRRSSWPSGLTPNNPASRSLGWESDPCLQYQFIRNPAQELFRGEVINQGASASILVLTTDGREDVSKR